MTPPTHPITYGYHTYRRRIMRHLAANPGLTKRAATLPEINRQITRLFGIMDVPHGWRTNLRADIMNDVRQTRKKRARRT